jgi:hypothetical protein
MYVNHHCVSRSHREVADLVDTPAYSVTRANTPILPMVPDL